MNGLLACQADEWKVRIPTSANVQRRLAVNRIDSHKAFDKTSDHKRFYFISFLGDKLLLDPDGSWVKSIDTKIGALFGFAFSTPCT